MNPKLIALEKVTEAKNLYKQGDLKGAIALMEKAIEIMENAGFYPLQAYRLLQSLEMLNKGESK